MEGHLHAPHLVCHASRLKGSSPATRGRKAFPPLYYKSSCGSPSVSKLPLSLSPWHLERSLIGPSSKFGVPDDTSVRWRRFRAGGGARWAQNITHMFPVHPPKALPTHSLTGEGRGCQLEALGFQEHTGGWRLWSQIPSAASGFCAGSARHHSHKLCQDKTRVSGLLSGPH